MIKDFYMATVTRIVEKASGKTSFEQTAEVSSKTLMGAVYFQCNNISDGEYPIPAVPTFGFAGLNGAGMFWVPKVGDHILVMIDTQLDQPQPYYICSLYTIPDNPMNEEWEINYPNRMGWISNVGHKFIFDDTEYAELIRLEHALGSLIEMDYGGNIYEKSVASRFSEIAGSSEHEILKDLKYVVVGHHTSEVSKDYTVVVKGNHSMHVKGSYTLQVDGNFTFEQKAMVQKFGTYIQEVKGGHVTSVGGGMKVTVGGCLAHAVLSNYARTTSGNEALLVAGTFGVTYGLGYTETIALGNKSVLMVAGNWSHTITAGNIDLLTLAGLASFGNVLGGLSVDILGGVTISSPLGAIGVDPTGAIDASNAAGGLSIDPAGTISLSNPLGEFSMSPAGLGKFGGAAGNISIDPTGNVTITSALVKVGGALGQVLTNITDPVVDTITGASHIGLPTFLA